MNTSLYVFTRDLRVEDNKALWESCEASDKVAPVYILDPEYLSERGITKEDSRFTLLMESLKELSKYTGLRVFLGKPADVLDYLLDKYSFQRVFMSYPHTESERLKAIKIEEVCSRHKVRLVKIMDNVLVDYTRIEKSTNFTSFYQVWRSRIDDYKVGSPPRDKFLEIDEPGFEEAVEKIGWRSMGESVWSLNSLWKRLRSFDFARYVYTKDIPGVDGTSRLSPYISHGVLSIRFLYSIVKEVSVEYVRQLAWREYYYHLMHKYPWMKTLELKPFMRNYEWNRDGEAFKAFIEGRTGYPIIDAGIRQLKKENWMHNRVRLIVANFLVKDLHIDWRQGEQFFKKYLIDYDEALNVGNWQWAASAGVDPLPIRIFNPILQSAKYDPDCTYIKRYVSELEGFKCEELHNPLKHRLKGYFEPIVDHYVAVEEFKAKVFNRKNKGV